MKFKIITEKGSEIEMEEGTTITIRLDDIPYEITIEKK